MATKKIVATPKKVLAKPVKKVIENDKPEKAPRGYEYKQFLVKKATDEKATKKAKHTSN